MVTKSDTDLDMDSETIHLVNTVRYGYLIKIADSGGGIYDLQVSFTAMKSTCSLNPQYLSS